MQRNVAALARKEYDLFIVGGGIYGASVARDAALRGLAVALVDKGDFGSATSANSHKIIHGGLRYLQYGDLKRMRESIRERSILMRIAPHLVRPLPFLVPTYRSLVQSQLIMWIALKLNDLISLDRNRGLEPQRIIPRGRVISREKCLRLCPGLDHPDLTGGALFFDGQLLNSDRLTLSILLSSAKAGADLANYVQVIRFLRQGDAVTGAQVRDVLTGDVLDVRAKMVVNCSGPWMHDMFQLLEISCHRPRPNLLKAVVLVARPIVHNIAIGVPCRSPSRDADAIIDKGHQYFFITPWRNKSLIGTFQCNYEGTPDDFKVTEKDIHDFIKEINAAFPAAAIKRDDVSFTYGGLVPGTEARSNGGGVQLAKEYRLHDHEREDGVRGLISVLGVKYTTAREVAERTVDLVLRRLEKQAVKCQTGVIPVVDGPVDCRERIGCQEVRNHSAGLSEETLGHLTDTYGRGYRKILRYCEEDPEWSKPVLPGSPVMRAEILHAVREEMAQKLADTILRRTELGTADYPGTSCLMDCAAIMGEALGWSERRIRAELDETNAIFANNECLR